MERAAAKTDRTSAEASSDGRVRRGECNRNGIVGALFELVQEGVLQPTAEQVAQRAGVGTRTVFRHFEDMDSLNAEITERLRGELLPRFAQPITGNLEQRVRELVRRRGEVFDRIAPFRRSAALIRWRSRFVQDEHREMVREQRLHLRNALPELADVPEGVVEALDMVTSFEAWERLRTDQRLGRDRAQAVVESAVRALLELA